MEEKTILQRIFEVANDTTSDGTTELIMRTVFAFVFGIKYGFVGICFATPAAWIGATIVLFGGYKVNLIRILKNRRKIS